jgi:DmsE family decaheme c-type cytochrome
MGVAGLVALGATLGWPGEAPETSAAPQYAGSAICAGCHEDMQAALATTMHGRVLTGEEAKGRGHLCEGCHGPGALHAGDPAEAKASAPLREAAREGRGCLACHEKRLSPVKWRASDHRRGKVTCFGCHGEQGKPHGEVARQPDRDRCLSCHRDQQPLFALNSHHPVNEKRVTCSDCHDPHVRMGREVRRDACVKCHQKQRGPFLFEHGAISGQLTEACLDCHRPHGSPNRSLLKLNNRGLCLQCHADKVNHRPAGTCWTCHAGQHGSNTSPILFSP